MRYYTGHEPGQIVGLLPNPYFWWEAGAMFMTLIEYWSVTGDSSYNQIITDSLLFQAGDDYDYMPPNQTLTEGNDDQAFWAFAALSAAEHGLPDLPNKPSWVTLAQAVFNLQAGRWDTAHCGGGLRWQIFSWNSGYSYKNTISNSCFFQIAARLARYTNDDLYFQWADTVYDWIVDSRLIGPEYEVYDGVDIGDNCTTISHLLWTYNYGNMIAGCAYMYNVTRGDLKWKSRLDGYMKSVRVFYPYRYGGNVLVEVACEEVVTCNIDQPAFKAFLSRWLAITARLAPYTARMIEPLIKGSARGAARQCTAADTSDGASHCGRTWYSPASDGLTGVGEQMSALSAVQNVLLSRHPEFTPKTIRTGAVSHFDPGAGKPASRGKGGMLRPDMDDDELRYLYSRPMTKIDRAVGWFVTSVVIFTLLMTGGWMVT